MKQDCMTTKETMEFMMISEWNFRRLLKDGKLKPVKFSSKRNMYRRDDILTCLIKMRTEKDNG